MRAEEALAAAAAEGLTLARKEDTPCGFWGVSKNGSKYKAQVRGLPGAGAKAKDKNKCLGAAFECPEEAALALARKYPTAAAKLAEREARRGPVELMSLQAVERIALAEGLTLLRDSSPEGFRGVYRQQNCVSRPYKAELPGRQRGAGQSPGMFASPHEAALAIARKLGAVETARLAAAGPTDVAGHVIIESHEMTSEEATRIAEEEGLVLRRKHAKMDEYWSVSRAQSVAERWAACIHVGRDYHRGSKNVYIGSFASAETAALHIARRLRDDARLLAHVTMLQQKAKARWSQSGAAGGKRKRAPEQSGDQDILAVQAESDDEDILEVQAVEVWTDDDLDDAVEVDATLVHHVN